MKHKTIYLLITALLIGMTIFSLNASKRDVIYKASNDTLSFSDLIRRYELATNALKRNEPKFYINGNYGMFGLNERSIKRSKVRSAKLLNDLIEDCPNINEEDFESVWIKSMFGEEDITVMSKGNELNEDQLALLQKAEIGDFFDIVVNYQIKEEGGELRHERINKSVTVIPEIQAEFPNGVKDLMAYFEKNEEIKQASIKFKNFSSTRLKFTINEKGNVEDIQLERASENPEVDQLILDLVSSMPNWTPAQNEEGSNVKQWFQLLYGSPGC